MRSRRVPIIITSVVGCAAVTLGLVPVLAPTAPPAPAAAAAHADPVPAIRARLAALERQADDAGRTAQVADEAVLTSRTAATRKAADDADAALQTLAARQTPELTRLATRLTALGEAVESPAATAETTALSGKTRALRAVSFARKQIGDRYGYAKAGPSAYDCSGLTMRSYSAVHVGIGGHSATAQYRKAAKQHRLVSYSHRRRGDLIFYGSPGSVYHVTIYAGNNRMVEAPYPGKRVREVAVRGGHLSKVARPTG